MDFKEFYFDTDDVEAMMDFVGAHWDFIYNVQYRNTVDHGEICGWCVRVKFDNSKIKPRDHWMENDNK